MTDVLKIVLTFITCSFGLLVLGLLLIHKDRL
jgi:hypothetical protein